MMKVFPFSNFDINKSKNHFNYYDENINLQLCPVSMYDKIEHEQRHNFVWNNMTIS